MDDTELLRALGGAAAVADMVQAGRSAVSMWISRGEIPAAYHLQLWRLATERGLEWRPPGSDWLSPAMPVATSPDAPENTPPAPAREEAA
jgi:hypothetical protein